MIQSIENPQVAKKIARIQKGASPRVLDLFAGCGGISLGFQLKGFDIIGALEIDEWAVKTHAMNFHPGNTIAGNPHAKARDLTKTEPDDFLKEIGITEKPAEAIDVIVGGPPCQAFARVGRAKLREVALQPDAYLQDPRGNLYLRYLYYVQKLHPVAILMENVPDVLNYGGHNIADEVCEALESMGYNCRYTLLNSVFYGVPEMRERMFLIGYRKELGIQPSFPNPTNWCKLPPGYHGTRQVALQYIGTNNIFGESYFLPTPEASPKKNPPAVSAEGATSDLPVITAHLRGELKRGTRRFNVLEPYSRKPANGFQKLMRNWPGFECHEGIYDHVIRSLPRDYAIFRRMNAGDQYPEAHKHALDLFEEALGKLLKQGKKLKPGSAEYNRLKKSIVPPYDATKFPNKWRKMERDLPARTLMAHLGKDSYSHIHYDSAQARTISVREAARLQSFPDGFKFCGTMNPAFKQVGNAVPPLMAASLAGEIIKILKGEMIEKAGSKKTDLVGSYAL